MGRPSTVVTEIDDLRETSADARAQLTPRAVSRGPLPAQVAVGATARSRSSMRLPTPNHAWG